MKAKSSLLIVALLMTSLPASYAATSTWSGLGGDNNWNTAGNWNALPVPPSDNLIFTGTTQTTTNNNFAADSTFTGINFNNTSTGGSFTLAGNRISLVGHITTTGTTGSPTHTISLDMILANQQSPNIAAYNNVKISGNISETGGAKSISVAGGGDLTLTGNNTFSGNVSIPWARLFVNSLANSGTASAIGTGSGISLSSGGSGAALIYEGTLAGGHSTNRTITMEGTTGSATINANGAGPVTFNGILAVNNSASSKTLNLGGTSTAANTFASDISTGAGNVTVTKSGAGTWVLSGSNTYGGTTAINAGTLLATTTAALPNYSAASKVSVASAATLAVQAGGAGWTSANIDSLLGATPAAFAGGSKFGIDVTTGNSFTYANNIGATQAAKSFVKTGAGSLTLSGNNTYTGATTVSAGTLLATTTAALPNYNAASKVSVASGATLAVQAGGAGWTSGNIDSVLGATTAAFASGSTFGIDVSTGNFTYANNIGATQAAKSFVKTGAGSLTLSGTNTYTGATTVSAGTLLVSAGIVNSTSGITANGSTSKFRYDSSTALTRNVAVTAGATFAYNSSGNYSGAFTQTSGKLGGTNWNGTLGGLTIGANQTITPGNSVGTASTTSQTWASLGSFDWEINKADGTAGLTAGGWDLLNLSSTLTISATSGSKFNINISSLGLDNLPGNTDSFADLTSYNWLFADSASAISGFSADKFTLNTSGFTNTFTGTFGIALGDTISGGDNTQLYITYTAVPEPSTWALLAASLTTVVVLRRCRNS